MRSDGGITPSQKPVLSLVYFGSIEKDIQDCLRQSFDELFSVLSEDLPPPEVQESWLSDPGRPGGRNSSGGYLTALDSFTNIAIGVTHCGLWSEFPFPRFIFASGGVDNSILSLYRFIHDSPSRKIARGRIAKEVPKALALASSVPVCDDPECYLSYHWKMADFDRNRGLCHACREQFVNAFRQMFPGASHD
jgi:predicted Zn-dependent protease